MLHRTSLNRNTICSAMRSKVVETEITPITAWEATNTRQKLAESRRTGLSNGNMPEEYGGASVDTGSTHHRRTLQRQRRSWFRAAFSRRCLTSGVWLPEQKNPQPKMAMAVSVPSP